MGKLFEDAGSRDAAVKPPWKGLRRSSKGFSQPKVTLKIANWELLLGPHFAGVSATAMPAPSETGPEAKL